MLFCGDTVHMSPKEAEFGVDVMVTKAATTDDPLDIILLGDLRQARVTWAEDYLRRNPEEPLVELVEKRLLTPVTAARILNLGAIAGSDDMQEVLTFIRNDRERIAVDMESGDCRRFGGALATRLSMYPDVTSDRAMLEDEIIFSAECAAQETEYERAVSETSPEIEASLGNSNIFDTRIQAYTVLGMLLDLRAHLNIS